MASITDLKPALLWKHFDEIRQIPRCSKNEKYAGEYVLKYAEQTGFPSKQDSAGNVLIQVPASPGHEKAPIIVLQGHLDMVCEKNSDKQFDFEKDAIEVIIDGDWVTANGTTLGADNGIGVAASLAVAEDSSVQHGPLELLFTTDEETGLNGATSISHDFLKGRVLINLDSEEEGTFFIGCAGGGDTEIKLPVQRKSASGKKAFSVGLKGLRGGHSGIDIHTGRGNAIQLLARVLLNLKTDIDLVSLEGGSKHNAIPREAFAVLLCDKEAELKDQLHASLKEIQFEYKSVEKEMTLDIQSVKDTHGDPLKAEDQARLLNLLAGLPHGVMAMSQEIKGLVETSNNLAIVKNDTREPMIYTSSRSSILSALEATRQKIGAVASLAGARVIHLAGYPAWTPNLDSAILKTMKAIYKNVTGKEAKVEAIHAGLECGIIGEKFEGMDMISFGPDLQNPHSPDERVHIHSVERFYKLLQETLKALSG
ncbi:aminoacyl-histidine dipeptidase [bacterium]|nr:aminoacyl-histidine dipeptidase [bacterium]